MYNVAGVPKLSRLQELSQEVRAYPVSISGLINYAERLSYEPEVIDFLNMFSRNMIFNDKSDFVYRCDLLEEILSEERQAIPEGILSPQD